MSVQEKPNVTALKQAVHTQPGTTSIALREQILASARDRAKIEQLPAVTQKLVDKVIYASYQVTDEDLKSLQADGYTPEQIFEIVGWAAIGAGLTRYENALRAIKGEQ